MTANDRQRKEPWRIRVPDLEYWREQVKCQEACPAHTDARGYVRAISAGKLELAYLIARGPNPLASICGRICGAPCEQACRRGDLDKPIAIRALKRYVCEQFGPETGSRRAKSLLEFLREASGRHEPSPCQSKDELLPFLQSLTAGDIPKASGKSVGIIGSGPAGLSAAHDLALLGFSVTLYEMEPVLGGMLAAGVPDYRLSRELVASEVEAITALGVEAVTDCFVGEDVFFLELRERHDAVIVAAGAKRSRSLDLPGAEGPGVMGGVEFLRDVFVGEPPKLSGTIVVIGGGNVAYDVGRTVVRQISLDAARTAKRADEVGDVYLCSLESLEEMPADDVEIIEGDEEGIIRRNGLGPKEIVRDEEGNVSAVRFKRCLRVYDENKNFNPVFDEDDITEIPCDTVLLAIGQSYDIRFVDADRDGLEMTERGLIACDPETGETSASDVFVAGDLAYGTKLLIHAVASGKAVARAIYKRLTGRAIAARDLELHFPLVTYEREKNYEKDDRIDPPTLSPEERLADPSRLVERMYPESQARCEAGRCLDCGVNTIFDGDRCILCGGCVDVCPEMCLRIVSPVRLDVDDPVREILSAQLGDAAPEEASAILKDETICIRCGLCAERCPSGAITMERFHFEENLQCQDA